MTNHGNVVCLVLNVERNKIGAIALDTDSNIKPGLYSICSGRLMSVPTGDSLLGRIIDPLGTQLMIKGCYYLKVIEWWK